MGKKLSIKGHLSRGKEVIELFKMMGGCECGYGGGGTGFYYYISQFGNIEASCKPTEFDTYIVYTLEEFLERFPYKVGDKVYIYIQNDDIDGRYDIEVAEITSMRWNPACCKIAYKMKDINREFYKEEIKCKVDDDSNKTIKDMGKKLAIKGHSTRGKEVIELLEMLGGINDEGYIGTNTWKDVYYYLDNGHIRAYDWCDAIKFTLEGFWEKYPFKVGDKVIDTADGCPGIVCEMKWDEGLSDMKYFVTFGNGVDFGWYLNDSIEFCEENENLEETQSNQNIDKVVDIFRKEFCECCGSQRCSGQDDELVYCERFKNLMDNSGKPSVENHKMGPKSKLPSKYYEVSMEETQSKREYDELRMPLDDDDKLATEATIMDKKILPPDGYLVGKITRTDNGILVEYVEKKPKYPTTYEECYDEGNTELHFIYVDKDERDLYESFIQLIRCRNAYWKIAGEKMGLDKPWEPAIQDTIWGITRSKDEIEKYSCHYGKTNLLEFPTEEMRDSFFKNFKDLIEQCKELL